MYRFAAVSSTMDEIDRLARTGAPEGTAVIAGVQESGKGRAGRSWQTEPGTALLCSILLRPELRARDISSLPLVSGVAIAEAIEHVAGLSTKLKWPNDVYVNGKKACGILAQSRSRGEQVEFVNLGFGINVNAPTTALPETATSLASEAGRDFALGEVERAVFAHLTSGYNAFLAAGGRPSLDPWLKRALFLGEEVEIQQERGVIAGRLTGVELDGSLRLETRQGEIRVAIGELTRGPRTATSAER
jgi:BirA family biotin operon repressor/biotin-[acetyl-CoA-carboxylase] ligase